MLSKTKSAAPTLRGNEKAAAKALERSVDLATHPPPSDELIQACADAFSRSPPSVAEAGVRHLRKKLQAADKNYDVALLSCGVAGRVVAASPAAHAGASGARRSSSSSASGTTSDSAAARTRARS